MMGANRWPLRLVSVAAILSVVFILGGCGLIPTPYQPRDIATGWGYTQKRVTDNTWEVSFRASPKTPSTTVARYFAYHCAELTKEQGFKYFVVLRNPSSPPQPSYAQPPAGAPPAVKPQGPANPEAPPAQGAGSFRAEPLGEQSTFNSGFMRRAAFDRGDRSHGGYIQVRGGGGGGGRGGGYYIYYGGGGYYVSPNFAFATIRMFNDADLPGPVYGYSAAEVVAAVSPFMKNQTVMVEIPRLSIIDPVKGMLPLPARAAAPDANAANGAPASAPPAVGAPSAPPRGPEPQDSGGGITDTAPDDPT
jgi:hypothetical protein